MSDKNGAGDQSGAERMAEWPERYRGNPLLVLLENYVVDIIGELAPNRRADLLDVTRQLWGDHSDADWKDAIRREVGLDENVDNAIRDNWQRFCDTVQHDGDPDTLEFARLFVDALSAESA